MNKTIKKIAAVIMVATTLQISGCVTDDEARLINQLTGSVLSAVPGMAGASSVYLAPAMQATQGVVNAITTHVIAKNRASLQQQQMAEAQGAEYYRRLSPQQRASAEPKLAIRTSGTPGVKGKPVMIYDTRTGKTTGTVYNVDKTPAKGGKMIIESTPATYIGSGSTPATYL
jgi:hypothetical protein